MKKIILFDLDGTLIDSTEAILESFHHTLKAHGMAKTVSDEMITSQIGHTLETMFAAVGIDAERIEMHVTTYKLYYRKISRQKTVLLPGAAEAIREASSFARLGIVTTKTGLYSRELMEHFELMHYFETLVGREHVEYAKPHPEPIFKALEQMGNPSSHVWMIGDTLLDIEASNRAGINCVAVTSGYDNAEQLLTLTDIIKSDALEAVRYIAQRG
ncbi:HAD family hydrolase [Sulfuricurvum sp.]|uniref:HAD family hydrolase n=1 Tax=Sulfuricurvum sp. TaxID=2025608 RepID=UPI00262E70E4|nr:HAD family hydrolase [Sulfuricurvum sp.]MDD2265825.1 HAD family hydrolase [Sulfuricurvum sp.]MDD2784909.1 HAD family hydrolase [Sulfuricurvum sp.]HZF70978.1 HAD family hydrolase [Sulfuricurvum sp.]